jgi:hypothetical protein
MSSAVIPVWICHHFKCFDFRVDLPNGPLFLTSRLLYAFSRQFNLRLLIGFFGVRLFP